MPLEKVSLTMRDKVIEEVDIRGAIAGEANRSGVITRDLERYYESLKRARADLRKRLSKAEVAAIVDNLNGVGMAEPIHIGLIYANVEDALSDGLAEKWGVDGPALVTKLKTLSIAENCALADAAERFWHQVGQGENPKISEALEG